MPFSHLIRPGVGNYLAYKGIFRRPGTLFSFLPLSSLVKMHGASNPFLSCTLRFISHCQTFFLWLNHTFHSFVVHFSVIHKLCAC